MSRSGISSPAKFLVMSLPLVGVKRIKLTAWSFVHLCVRRSCLLN